MLTRPLTLRPLLLVPILAAVGCAQLDRSPQTGWDVVDEPEPTTVEPVTPSNPVVRPDNPGQPTTQMDCALETSYTTQSYWVEPHFSGFTPNEGLFVSARGYAGAAVTVAVTTGEAYPATTLGGLRDVNTDWTVGVFEEPYGVFEFRELGSGRVLSRHDGYVVEASISADGEIGAVMSCEGESSRVDIVDLTTAAVRTVSLDVGEPCYGWSASRNRAQFTGDNATVVVTTVAGNLWTVDTQTLATRSVRAHAAPEGEYYETVIADVRIRPGDREVVTTGVDGKLRRWSLPELTQVGADREVGVFLINEMTYGPRYRVSPVAFTPDGRTMAWVNLDGNIVLENTAGSTILESPAVPEEIAEWETNPNVPVTISFSPTGERIGVGYYFTQAVWGCPGREIARTGQLEINAPSVIDIPAEGYTTVDIDVRGAGPIAALRARTADGEVYNTGFQGHTMSVWATTDQDLVIEADDGFASASMTVRLRFIQ